MISLDQTTCSATTAALIWSRYPEGNQNALYRRAIAYLLFGDHIHKETGCLVLNIPSLEWIAGEKINHSNSRKSAYLTGMQVIGEIQQFLPKLKVSGWKRPASDFGANRAHGRLVLNSGIDRNIINAVEAELVRPAATLTDRVYVLSGKKYNGRAIKGAREKWSELAAERSKGAASAASLEILESMNNLADRPIAGFTKATNHIRLALNLINRYSPREKATSRPKKELSAIQKHQVTQNYRRMLRRQLRSIEDFPQPFYVPSKEGRTERVFPLNTSLLSIPSDLRRAMSDAAGWIDLDLTAAHLAIGARLWNISSIQRMLASGESPWVAIPKQLNCPHLIGRTDFKKALKDATYSAMFGMPESNLKAGFTRSMNKLGIALKGQDLVDTPVVQDLLRARGAAFQQVRGGITPKTPTGIQAPYIKGERNEGSVWSTVANSYECALMLVILRYEKQELIAAKNQNRQPDFRIMLWQHDGCSIRFSKRRKTHLTQLQNLVSLAASTHGIATRLEHK